VVFVISAFRLRAPCRASRSALLTFLSLSAGSSAAVAQGSAPPATSSSTSQAGQSTATLSGTITDPSGALVPGAVLRIGPQQASTTTQVTVQPRTVVSDASGRFLIALPPGTYTVTIEAEGFNGISRDLTVDARPVSLNLRLSVAAAAVQVEVPSDTSASTASSDNQSALVFKGDRLDALSSNDSTLQQQMLAMSGGSGEGGGSVYVDGFSGGRFPPKDTIREIRINENPFSSQYADLGLGRIEIFTKPGTNKLHGEVFSSASTRAFNSLNPYTGAEPPYYLLFNRGDVNGPLGKKSSFFLSGQVDNQQNNAVVNAFNPDGSRLSLAVSAPTTDYTFASRIDRQLNPTNTLIGRYEYSETDSSNTGVGLLVLPSQGTRNGTNVQTLQLGNTQLIGPNIVSETRFQYLRTRLGQTPNSTAPTLIVQGAFNAGGSPTQATNDSQDQFEFQEYLSFSQGNHFLRLGARYRLLHEVNSSTANYNGQFTFPTLAAFQAGTPSLFSLTAGQASASLLTGDLGAYAEDEWKMRRNVTANFGLRIESQSAVPDHLDPAPRAGIAWAVGQTDKHPPIVLLRASAGVFYARFAAGNILTSIRQNGFSQQAFLISNPTFYPNLPNPAQLTGTSPTPYGVSPGLRIASENIASVSAERSFGKVGSVSVSYYAVRGVHQYNSENINAPLPGGQRPLGGNNDVYRFASNGIEKGQSIVINTNLQPTKRFSIFAFYTARRQNDDTFGAASFPSQPYNVSADYGPSGLGMQPVGQRLFADASLKLPFGFSGDAFVGAFSHSRFNITTGTDRNSDTQFNDRPAFATNPGASSVIYNTAFGSFDANPQPGEAIIPYNFGLAPRLIFLAMELNREFKFGPRPEAPAPPPGALKPGQKAPLPDPRYSLSFSLDSVNTTNTNNPGPPVGVLASPFFGHSISTNNIFGLTSAANRVIFLHSSFRF